MVTAANHICLQQQKMYLLFQKFVTVAETFFFVTLKERCIFHEPKEMTPKKQRAALKR